MSRRKVKVGTRGSLLATTQTGMVVEALRQANPDIEFEVVIVKTGGDADQKTPLHAFSSTGVFIKELEEALYRKEIDLAVHSLKDVPHEIPQEMELVAYFDREDPRDALISTYGSIENLPKGATVGTGSPRRVIQLKNVRSDLKFVELRGNIDTRLKKAKSGELDGVILACAGLDRMGWSERITRRLSVEEMLPAIGQGIVVIEARANEEEIRTVAQKIDRTPSRAMAFAERYFMEQMGGGCKVPLAALARVNGEKMEFVALLGDLKSSQSVKLSKTFSLSELQGSLDEFVVEFKKVCQSLSLALPSELPEHYLLEESKHLFL